jgi:SEC-C motif-containing protein
MSPKESCPCGSGNTYGVCCGPLHAGAVAATAVSLMRSRYSAYVLKQGDYLLDSWHASTRPPTLDLADGDDGTTRWLGLNVKAHREDGDAAMVEFVARYKVGGTSAQRVHELSRFVREDGFWFYLDGVQR